MVNTHLAIGSAALETIKLAQSMVKGDWVKRFAGYELAEQTTIAEILKSMGFRLEKGLDVARMARTDLSLETDQGRKDECEASPPSCSHP